MYQCNISVEKSKASWLKSIERILELQFKAIDGVVASGEHSGRAIISIACEKDRKKAAKNIITETLIEMYLTAVKYEHLKKRLKLTHLSDASATLLIHSLVAFDREAEKEIAESALKFNDNIALDGIFNFKLAELKQRWNEIAQLATSNSNHLHHDDTLNELLRFLVSAVTPKIKKLAVGANEHYFVVKGIYNKNNFEVSFTTAEQLMVYLINVAPLELTLEGDFSDKKLYNTIVSIFDGKAAK